MAKKKSHNKKAANSTSAAKPIVETKAQPVVEEVALSNVWTKAFSISLIAVFALMTIMSFWYGLSGDEVDMNEYGKAILKYFTSFGSDDLVFNMPKQYDRDGVILYYGGFFDLLCAAVNSISPFAEYTTRHILNAWVGFGAIFFSARIVGLITDKRIATACVWLMFLSPFFLGHAMNNPKDVPFATAYIAAIYFIIRFFERMPKASKKDYLWVILSIGIAINIRIGGLLLLPYLFVFAGIIYLFKSSNSGEKLNLKDYVKPIAIIAVLGYLAGSLFWPYAHKDPISNPLEALKQMSNFKMSLGQIWEGEKVMSSELPSGYLIKSFIITNSYAILLGLIGFGIGIKAALKHKRSHIVLFVLFTALFPLMYIIYKKSNVYHAWRHVLFIFPSFAIIASLGWSYINDLAGKKWKRNVGLGLLLVLLLEPTIFTVTTFPNTVTYHNQFAGGVEGAYGNYEVDYYYNSVKQCADYYINEELPKWDKERKPLLVSNAFHLVEQYVDRANSDLDYISYQSLDAKKWDYAIIHIALVPLTEIQSGSWLPADAEFVAMVKGKPLSALIKRASNSNILGFEALQKGQPRIAVQHFTDYLKEDSTNINVLATTARLYMDMNVMDSAYYYSQKAYAIDNKSAEIKRVYAMSLSYKGNHTKALELFQEIVRDRPDFVAGHYYIGMMQKNLGDLQSALNSFNTASKVPELTRDCFMQMGDIYKASGNQQEAKRMYSLATGR